jgi:cytochrome P450
MRASDEDKLPEEEVLAQMSYVPYPIAEVTQCRRHVFSRLFAFAASDTTANAISKILELLAQHPEAQEKLRKEVTEARGGQDISYDDLQALTYLDAIVRETLRL